jgi:hypothetical protein
MRKDARNPWISALPLWLAFVFLADCVLAQDSNTRRSSENRALQATIKTDGIYELAFRSVGWRLVGRLPQVSPTIQMTHGKDAIGSYEALSAAYLGEARTAEIRIYQGLPVALFRDTWNTAGHNEHPFPTFDALVFISTKDVRSL